MIFGFTEDLALLANINELRVPPDHTVLANFRVFHILDLVDIHAIIFLKTRLLIFSECSTLSKQVFHRYQFHME